MVSMRLGVVLVVVGCLTFQQVLCGSSSSSSSSSNEDSKHRSHSPHKARKSNLPKDYIVKEPGLTDEENRLYKENKLALAWREEFNERGLDPRKWTKTVSANRGGGVKALQYYSYLNDVCKIENGHLVITPKKSSDVAWNYDANRNFDPYSQAYSERQCNIQPCHKKIDNSGLSFPYLSAEIHTAQKFSFHEGILVIRAKMPRGAFLWPSIQLQSDKHGEWPKSGAVTIAQTRGNLDYRTEDGRKQIGNSVVESGLFFGEHGGCMKTVLSDRDINIDKEGYLSDKFRVYKYVWKDGVMRFFVDNKKYGEINLDRAKNEASDCVKNFYRNKGSAAPFDSHYHLRFKVDVGGWQYFRDNCKIGDKQQQNFWSYGDGKELKRCYENMKDWGSDSWGPESSLQVDYIRLYQERGNRRETALIVDPNKPGLRDW